MPSPVPAHPVLEALRNAPKGDPSLLTEEDRARIEENRQARARGEHGVPHAKVLAMLEERKRSEGR